MILIVLDKFNAREHSEGLQQNNFVAKRSNFASTKSNKSADLPASYFMYRQVQGEAGALKSTNYKLLFIMKKNERLCIFIK